MQSSEDNAAPLARLGRYELIARIAEGGMAEVYLARMLGPMNFQKVVVLKKIHPNLAAEKDLLNMLLDEARLSALIKHPRVVDIYELGREDDTYFIAMEHLEGQSLTAVLSACVRGHALSPILLARLVADAAEGLHAAHELQTMSGEAVELVHRDVSPANIIALYDGTAKIVDFGIAKARGRLTQSGVHQLKGKLGYMSPEQLTARPLDRRSDIYGLGIVLWECLALRRLFAGEAPDALGQRLKVVPPPSLFRPDVPKELDAICLRALAVDPGDRFQSAGLMAQAIGHALRKLGSQHEAEEIAVHMRRVFSRQRAERRALLRRGTNTEISVAQPIAAGTPPPASAPVPVPVPVVRSAHHGRFLGTLTAILVATAILVVPVRTQLTRPPTIQSSTVELPVEPIRPGPAPQPPLPFDFASLVEGATYGVAAHARRATLRPARPAARTPGKRRPWHKPAPSAATLHKQGVDLLNRGKPSAAVGRFKAALALSPDQARSYRGLGFGYQALGQTSKARESFEMYLLLAPKAPDATTIQDRLKRLRK
jgi:eukaryotic-like serine/threonine-protein kinase